MALDSMAALSRQEMGGQAISSRSLRWLCPGSLNGPSEVIDSHLGFVKGSHELPGALNLAEDVMKLHQKGRKLKQPAWTGFGLLVVGSHSSSG